VQHQPGVGAGDQRTQVIDPHPPGHPTGVLEEPHQALQRVGAVHQGGELPALVKWDGRGLTGERDRLGGQAATFTIGSGRLVAAVGVEATLSRWLR
jgi:hypothetical protein